MNFKRWGQVWLLFCAGFLLGSSAWGQTTGGIRGSVQDSTGAVVPGATVVATLVGTDSTRKVSSGQDGSFDIPELAVGTYSIAIEAQGFKRFVAKDIVVSIGHVAVVTATLQVGGSAQTVTVEANAVQVETTSTQLGAVMTDQSISELPLSTRNTYQLLQLQPGVQSQLGADLFYGSSNAGVVSVNGGRGRSNNYMVNGGDGNDMFVNSPAVQPSPDSIEEFRVLTNTFDAEYGRNSGSIVNVVTKSGTNNVHGDFYEFNRNNAYNTRGYFDPAVADYKQNQFGATIGGPVKKDRTFIFGSYEGNRLVQGVSSGKVQLPTTNEVGGDFSEGGNAAPFQGTLVDQNFANVLGARTTGSTNGTTCDAAASAEQLNAEVPVVGVTNAVGDSYSQIFPNNVIPTECFDPTAVALYNKWVAPFGTGTFTGVPNDTDREDQFTVRFDHKINSAQQFSAYYYFNDDDTTNAITNFQSSGANVPGFGGLFKSRNQQWNLSHTWTIGSSAVNEFRFNYFREGEGDLNHPLNTLQSVQDACGPNLTATCFTDPNNPTAGITTNIPGRVGVPLINVSGGFTIGNNYNGEIPQVGNTFQWSDNYTKTVGNHTIKFGGDVRRQRFNLFAYYNINGFYTISNNVSSGDLIVSDSTYPGYPNYFLGATYLYAQGAAQGEDLRNSAVYTFAQDSFKLKPNLTLNYGLRWELNTPFYDLGNRLQTYRPGVASTQYPCVLNPNNPANPSATALYDAYGSTDCSETGPAGAIFPLGLVFPGDKGVQRGLTQTYYKEFAPRIGIAWSPNWTDGWLAKLTGGPGNSSIRAGFGLFYNPIEALVMEQYSGEPPFGGSVSLSDTLFNLPFEAQSGGNYPNVFQGIINQTPQTPCSYDPSGPNGCVDWSAFRPMLLFGEFQPNLKSQYSEQYNLTIERQLTKDMLLRVAYVGTEAHHLLASYDLDHGNPQTCLDLQNLYNTNNNWVLSAPGGSPLQCTNGNEDLEYYIPPTAVIPAGGFQLPYNGTPGGNPTVVPAGPVSGAAPNGIVLVGTRGYSSPNCQPLSGTAMTGCPADGVPVFSSIYAEGTIANSDYNALQLSVEKSYSHGLLFQASYTLSKAIDQAASFENELDPLDFNFTRGLSLLDAKNRFVFSPVWQIPVPKYEGFKGKAMDGWGASAIITYQSGFPIRIQNPNDDELQGSVAFFEGANTPEVTGPIQFMSPKTSANNPKNIYFTGAFSDPNPGTFGNVPHALCCGPAISNTDLVLNKKTRINETWDTEFRAEFYNAGNHTQFNNPDGNFADSTFGQVLKTREGPRLIQFALKFLF